MRTRASTDQNPCKHRLVRDLLKVLDKYYKKVSQAKSGWTKQQWFRAPDDPYVPHVVVVHNDEELSPYVRGQLRFDKNADARKPRRFYLPEEVPALGVRPVELLENYILRERVPSWGPLFTAPKGATGWYGTPYKGHRRAFKKAYLRAFPAAEDAS
ncbi:hypothetical protein CYMTET_7071 [Cymbomonas tetramitiformis]|uniref:Uncharacterized protein n=1 Tax=Cymbomonas tetramitiformis TaxID=36881 RepID=A0AAE0LHT5_9CHLO|nr:hypothetical protein CYMTET_7071 [Cymbomonas tetramitiformis]